MRKLDGTESTPWYFTATPLATRPWLIRLRWASAGAEALIALVAWAFPDLELPLRRIAVIVLAAAVSNAWAASWLSREGTLPRPVAAIGLALDALLLTGLLELTGGPFNPFVVVFAVQVILAALTLGGAYATAVGWFAAACYAMLVYWHLHELEPGHHRVNDLPTHLFAMWMFLTVTVEVAAFFITQASGALARHEEELEGMRRRAARSERLAALTTLAAGAAHELSTPLATIALTARELEHAISANGPSAGLTDDARLIRAEVDRCRAILDQMSGRAGGIAEDVVEPIDLGTLLDDVRQRLASAQAGRLRVELPRSLEPVHLPRAGFRQAVLTLVKNACEASDAEVIVQVAQDGARMRLTVRDNGPGLAPEALSRAGEPFYTTKPPGRGLGLGLFLARVFAERLGGTLTLQSDAGTIASLDLPIRAASSGAV